MTDTSHDRPSARGAAPRSLPHRTRHHRLAGWGTAPSARARADRQGAGRRSRRHLRDSMTGRGSAGAAGQTTGTAAARCRAAVGRWRRTVRHQRGCCGEAVMIK